MINRPEIDVNFNSLVYKQSGIESSYNPLFHAALFNNSKIVKLLIDHPNIDVNIKSFEKTSRLDGKDKIEEYHPLFETINTFNIEIMKILLSHDQININLVLKKYDTSVFIHNHYFSNVEEITAMFFAIKNGYIEMVKLLLSHPK